MRRENNPHPTSTIALWGRRQTSQPLQPHHRTQGAPLDARSAPSHRPHAPSRSQRNIKGFRLTVVPDRYVMLCILYVLTATVPPCSMGAVSAVFQAARDLGVAGVVLDSPFASLKQARAPLARSRP